MINKKTMVVLVIVAVLLVLTAFLVNSYSEEIKTEKEDSSLGGGKVGIEIMPPTIEDKLANNEN